jgi:ABC-type microcin C transport system duplicated ATPase subunit YejF
MLKRSLMVAVAVAAVIAGVVLAASSGGGKGPITGHRPAVRNAGDVGELAVAASYLGLPKATLRRDLRGGQTLAQIASSTSGKSTTGLIDALVRFKAGQLEQLEAKAASGAGKAPASTRKTRIAALTRRTRAEVNRVRGYVGFAAIARYLGISEDKLHLELESGRSVAQIAEAIPGKSASGLIDARVSEREDVVKKALSSGRISQSTEKALLAMLRQRVQAEVQRTPGR